MTRVCKTCHEEKPLEEFQILRKNGVEYRERKCKLCRLDQKYRSERNRPDRVRNRLFSALMASWPPVFK